MAEKEERISIELLKDDFCDSCDNRGKLKNCCCYEKQEYDERYQKSIPRQEAIERMAGAIHRYEYEHTSHFPTWCELNDDIKNDYRNMAEAALDALLEGK